MTSNESEDTVLITAVFFIVKDLDVSSIQHQIILGVREKNEQMVIFFSLDMVLLGRHI
jgi:hypothetical protein